MDRRVSHRSPAARFLSTALAALLLMAILSVLAARSPGPRAPSAAGLDETPAALIPSGQGTLAGTARVPRSALLERNERSQPASAPIDVAVIGCLVSGMGRWGAIRLRRNRTPSFTLPYLAGPRAPPLQLD